MWLVIAVFQLVITIYILPIIIEIIVYAVYVMLIPVDWLSKRRLWGPLIFFLFFINILRRHG